MPQPDRTTELVDSFRNLNMQVGQWVNDGASLLATTSEVDFDPNGKNYRLVTGHTNRLT